MNSEMSGGGRGGREEIEKILEEVGKDENQT